MTEDRDIVERLREETSVQGINGGSIVVTATSGGLAYSHALRLEAAALITAQRADIDSLRRSLARAEDGAKRWTRLARMADTGTADSFLKCDDDVKRDFFAMAVDDSSRRKRAEEDLEALRQKVREALKPACEDYNLAEELDTLGPCTEMLFTPAELRTLAALYLEVGGAE